MCLLRSVMGVATRTFPWDVVLTRVCQCHQQFLPSTLWAELLCVSILHRCHFQVLADSCLALTFRRTRRLCWGDFQKEVLLGPQVQVFVMLGTFRGKCSHHRDWAVSGFACLTWRKVLKSRLYVSVFLLFSGDHWGNSDPALSQVGYRLSGETAAGVLVSTASGAQ